MAKDKSLFWSRFWSALSFPTTASSIPASSTRKAEPHSCEAECLVPTGVGPAKAAGLSKGSTEQSSSSREQKGINHLAVIRGSVSTACLRAFLLPVNAPVCCTLRQMQPSRVHQPWWLQLLPTLCQCCWRLRCQDGNGHFLIALSALLHWRLVKTKCASPVLQLPAVSLLCGWNWSLWSIPCGEMRWQQGQDGFSGS